VRLFRASCTHALHLGISARDGTEILYHILDRLDTGFLIHRDSDDVVRSISIFVAEVYFAVHHENLVHLFVKLFVPFLKVIAYLMGLEGLRLENSKDRCLGYLPKTWVARIYGRVWPNSTVSTSQLRSHDLSVWCRQD
jgi:hypothetical protein